MQVVVRAAFFLWLTAANLVALSSVWARIAEVFDSHASKRLFGFLGAGATCGDAPCPCRGNPLAVVVVWLQTTLRSLCICEKRATWTGRALLRRPGAGMAIPAVSYNDKACAGGLKDEQGPACVQASWRAP